jgi:hypothetical protein
MFCAFLIAFVLFCLTKKVPKKGPAINNSMIAAGSLMELLYYCGEEQQGLDLS